MDKFMKPIPVLIVDDSSSDRYLLTRDLQQIGLGDDIHEAVDGLEAFEFLAEYDENKAKLGERFPPVVIFLDINMPRMNGFEFLERFADLRSHADKYDTMVVLMVSSSAHLKEKEAALERDFVSDFIVKGSTSSAELSEKVRRALAD